MGRHLALAVPFFRSVGPVPFDSIFQKFELVLHALNLAHVDQLLSVDGASTFDLGLLRLFPDPKWRRLDSKVVILLIWVD